MREGGDGHESRGIIVIERAAIPTNVTETGKTNYHGIGARTLLAALYSIIYTGYLYDNICCLCEYASERYPALKVSRVLFQFARAFAVTDEKDIRRFCL